MHRASPRKPRTPLTEDRRQLAEQFLPMARSLAWSLKVEYPSERDEIESAVCLALVEAARTYDPARNVKFSTYARYRILGALGDVKRRMIPLGYRSNPKQAPIVCRMPFLSDEEGRVMNSEPDRPAGHMMEAIENVEEMLRKLPRRHASACRRIYLHEQTRMQAARELGCSTSRIARLHNQSVAMLSDSYNSPDAD